MVPFGAEQGSRFHSGAAPATVNGEPRRETTGRKAGKDAKALIREPGDLPSRFNQAAGRGAPEEADDDGMPFSHMV
jgi:hypothetical protein